MKNKVIRISNKEHLKHPEGSVFKEGYGQIAKLVMCDKSLSVTAKAIYAYLCSYAGGGDVAYPGIKRICEDLKIKSHTFHKYFKQIEEAGYIKKSRVVFEDGKFANNIYQFVYELPKSKAKANNE